MAQLSVGICVLPYLDLLLLPDHHSPDLDCSPSTVRTSLVDLHSCRMQCSFPPLRLFPSSSLDHNLPASLMRWLNVFPRPLNDSTVVAFTILWIKIHFFLSVIFWSCLPPAMFPLLSTSPFFITCTAIIASPEDTSVPVVTFLGQTSGLSSSVLSSPQAFNWLDSYITKETIGNGISIPLALRCSDLSSGRPPPLDFVARRENDCSCWGIGGTRLLWN